MADATPEAAAPEDVRALVHLDVADGVATITLDSPRNRNALSTRLVDDLAHCVRTADDTADVRVMVVRHEGSAFCAGADLTERAAASGPPDATPIVDVMRRLMDSPRPTIAAVDGAVRAGGIGLMAACDLVVVSSAVTFALTEVRVGVAPAIISVPILRRVPPARIAAAMLTGEVFGAAEARDIGLVSHVTDDVAATVRALCDGVRAGAPGAVAETKRLLWRVPAMGRDDAFGAMAALSSDLFGRPEAVEGIAAFSERRPPDWSQRR